MWIGAFELLVCCVNFMIPLLAHFMQNFFDGLFCDKFNVAFIGFSTVSSNNYEQLEHNFWRTLNTIILFLK